MGFGPPTRRPFAFLAKLGFVRVWDTALACKYDEFIVALDSNVVLHTLVHKDDTPNEALGFEEYIQSTLRPRIGGMMHRILSPLRANVTRKRCIELEDVQERQTRIVVFLGCDNGAPLLKHYARERRQTARLNPARKLISEPGAVHCFLGVLQQVIQQMSNVTVITAKDAPGEGEFSCMRFLNSFGDNNPRRLLVIASSDSNVILYGILAHSLYKHNLGMLVLNASVWSGTDREQHSELQMVDLSAFAQLLVCDHRLNIPAYIFFLTILVGNDFMPSIMKTTVDMAQIHLLVARFTRDSPDISFAAMIRFLKHINSFEYFKAGQKTVVSKAERIAAFEALFTLAEQYSNYLRASCPDVQKLSLRYVEHLQEDTRDALCMTSHEAWREFMSAPPFKFFLLLNRSINNTLWRPTLCAIEKQFECKEVISLLP